MKREPKGRMKPLSILFFTLPRLLFILLSTLPMLFTPPPMNCTAKDFDHDKLSRTLWLIGLQWSEVKSKIKNSSRS